MDYPPYCICCGSRCIWSSDWDASDFGYKSEGVIGLYICSNIDCNAHIEVRDLHTSALSEERSLKYYFSEDSFKSNISINNCLYCSSDLNKAIENDNYIIFTCKDNHNFNCNLKYTQIDSVPIYSNSYDDCNLYESRTILVNTPL